MVPFIVYTYLTAIIGFMIIGIGNTVLQVSANPLLLDISAKGNKAANLSLSQFIKAIASMLGPVIAAALASYTGNWRLIFPIYAGLSLVAVAWLYSVSITETQPVKAPATFGSVLSLLKKRYVVIMIIATFLIVGFDVGMNSNISTFLVHRFPISIETASLGISIYFASLVAGRFIGSIVLRTIKPASFLFGSIIITLMGLTGIMVTREINLARIMIFVAGLGFSNIFPILFAVIVERMPEYDNELSSLIILSVIGGAVIPPVMGVITDHFGVTTSMLVLVVCIIYVFIASWYALAPKDENPLP